MNRLFTNKIWLVKREKDDLCYMTLDDNTKAVENKKQTGLNWAKTQRIETFDNDELDGFVIHDYAARYRGNKLLRVTDPRGFTVETPVYNFVETMQHCLIDKGVVKTKCVWSYDGGGHLLLPKHLLIHEKPKAPKKLSVKELEIGCEYDNMIYLGRGNVSFDLSVQLRENKLNYLSWHQRDLKQIVINKFNNYQEKHKTVNFDNHFVFCEKNKSRSLYLYKSNPAKQKTSETKIMNTQFFFDSGFSSVYIGGKWFEYEVDKYFDIGVSSRFLDMKYNLHSFEMK